jgi:radical SAM superfamily enzyme
MTLNEIMVVQSCVNQTQLYSLAVLQLTQLVQLQLQRELKMITMPTDEYKKYVVEVMDFVIPIVSSLAKE